eukprot:Plantae.Rhodophyta-Hildenbrandia_rubra.ctg1434.p1 GENE.Plantae.Rhodophyta-Hildenbrandia_rubra.ctg1434~~Plantae.Rhodophyta-Hildenbrandia_rubra.ctg1434.p1  ORF type:complete len:677 (+),score=142.49 Plantae.Rhodophyta-Hildenbrandia_rubra.ctg1434:423-2453(+)
MVMESNNVDDQVDIEAGVVAGENTVSAPERSALIAPPGVSLAWQDISFSVTLKKSLKNRCMPKGLFKKKKKKKGEEGGEEVLGSSSGSSSSGDGKVGEGGVKRILDKVSGIVHGGELLFIMGPSGSGKTSLLDVLAGHVAGKIEGDVLLSGVKKSQCRFMQVAKYVEQTEHMYASLTTEETLMFAAEFYIENKEDRKPRVDSVLKVLGLQDARKIRVGGTFFRGLSGGQRRRLAIGIELLAKPAVLLLDEPTSGLDAAAAYHVTKHLQSIAHDLGTSVVCSIHQPAKVVYDLADTVLLLSRGRTAYFGPVNEGVDYFATLGRKIPSQVSPPEYLLSEINADFDVSDAKLNTILDAWPLSRHRRDCIAKIEESRRTGEEPAVKRRGLLRRKECYTFPRSQTAQMGVLTRRNFIDTLRNPAVFYLRFGMYLALGLFIGIAWLRVPATADRIRDLQGSLFFLSAFMVFMSLSILPVYLDEKLIVTRERMNGSYSVLAYLVGHFIVECVFLAIMSIIISGVVYYTVGYNPEFGRFCFFALALFLSLLVAESIMIVIASIVPFLLVGIASAAFLFGIFMVHEGYFLQLKNITWALRWINKIALHSYSFSAFIINEFSGRTYAAAPDAFPPFLEDVSGKSVIDSLDLVSTRRWVNIGVMCAMVVFYRTVAFFWIKTFHTGKK